MRKGQRCPPEVRAILRAAALGDKNPMKRPEVRAKNSASHLGHEVSLATRAKISAGLTGQKPSAATRNKMSVARVGFIPSAETCAKLSKANTGPKHPQWRGGISREPYAWTFSPALKEAVRCRDGYRCQLCGVLQAECEKKLPVHHADYDKGNSSTKNLVTLCNPCNSKVNFHREHWTAYFRKKALNRREEIDMFMLHVTRSRHFLSSTPTPLDKYLQREYPDRKLFTYFHLTTKNWVIAEWCNKMRGTAMEVLILGQTPRLLDREQATELRQRLRAPANRGAIRQNLDALERARLLKEEHDAAELEDATARLIRDAHPGPGAGSSLFLPSHSVGAYRQSPTFRRP